MFHWHLRLKQGFCFNGSMLKGDRSARCLTDQQAGQGCGRSQHLLPGQPRPRWDEAEPGLLQDDGGGPRGGLQGPRSQAAYGMDHPPLSCHISLRKGKSGVFFDHFQGMWFPIYVLVMSAATRRLVCCPPPLPVGLCSSIPTRESYSPWLWIPAGSPRLRLSKSQS